MRNSFAISVLAAFSILSFKLGAATLYVDLHSVDPTPPYADLFHAATKIQDAVDAANNGDLILVTNGVYQTGGRVAGSVLTNRVVIAKTITVQSINGPAVTSISGFRVPGTTLGTNAVRCVYLTNGAALIGFTLTNGATATTGAASDTSGGAVCCASSSEILSNCIIVRSSAYNDGGGVYQGALFNCSLSNNSAGLGGGEYGGYLFGCNLASNSASLGGGAYSGTLIQCGLSNNVAVSWGGGAFSANLTNCTLSSNSAQEGGGAQGCTLDTCALVANRATAGGGGGGYSCAFLNSTLTGNSATDSGGGAYNGSLTNCVLTANTATNFGGGVYDAPIQNCTLSGNIANSGGGASNCGTENSAFIGNIALTDGGGARSCALQNCTIIGNSAYSFGGGTSQGSQTNCIVFYNAAPQACNYSGINLDHCCTTPLPPSGAGNITADPQLASLSHLSATSPCRGAGTTAGVFGVDIDGENWAAAPSIGCDEYNPGFVTGALSASIQTTATNVAVGFTVAFTANISGRVTGSLWDFGDGTVVSNQPYATHNWTAARDYPVVLSAYNESFPSGISSTVTIHVINQPVFYVAVSNTTPSAPFNSWSTAATNIQDAVDAATVPGSLVLVSNGNYSAGGRVARGPITNRVALMKPLVVASVNGPSVTAIIGNGISGSSAVRCAYLTNGASLMGFSLSNGATGSVGSSADDTQWAGGGAWSEFGSALLSNCWVLGNSAWAYGGGLYHGTIINSVIVSNSAFNGGGATYNTVLQNCIVAGNYKGASGGTFKNCTIVTNSPGGITSAEADNCIIYYNVGANYNNGVFNNCCTVPYPSGFQISGFGNFTNAPQFVNLTNWNFHLQSNSPCINSGNNVYLNPALTSDLDGNPRVTGGTVDMGAYEFQFPKSIISYAWLQQYGLPTDGSVDYADLDGTGFNVYQDWIAGLNPTNSASVLEMQIPVVNTNSTGLTVSWLSVSNRMYFLQRATNLAAQPAFSIIQSNIAGQPGTTSFLDTTATNGGPYFYRVGVQTD